MSGRPIGLSAKLAWYLFTKRVKGEKFFPLTMILEPLEACNLTCTGCGRIREYEPIIDKQLTVDECLSRCRRLRSSGGVHRGWGTANASSDR